MGVLMYNYSITLNGYSIGLTHDTAWTQQVFNSYVKESEDKFFSGCLTYVDDRQYLAAIGSFMCDDYGFQKVKGMTYDIKGER